MANTRENKESCTTHNDVSKLSLVISYTDFHPVYDLKGDKALGNSFKLMPKQTNSNKVLLHVQSETGNLYQIVSLKSS